MANVRVSGRIDEDSTVRICKVQGAFGLEIKAFGIEIDHQLWIYCNRPALEKLRDAIAAALEDSTGGPRA
jgi:hypothetical protein